MFSFKTVFVSGKCATVNSESSPTILLDSSRIISISFLKKKKKNTGKEEGRRQEKERKSEAGEKGGRRVEWREEGAWVEDSHAPGRH